MFNDRRLLKYSQVKKQSLGISSHPVIHFLKGNKKEQKWVNVRSD